METVCVPSKRRNGITPKIFSKKPKTAIFLDSTPYLRRYKFGAYHALVPKKGVKLKYCD